MIIYWFAIYFLPFHFVVMHFSCTPLDWVFIAFHLFWFVICLCCVFFFVACDLQYASLSLWSLLLNNIIPLLTVLQLKVVEPGIESKPSGFWSWSLALCYTICTVSYTTYLQSKVLCPLPLISGSSQIPSGSLKFIVRPSHISFLLVSYLKQVQSLRLFKIQWFLPRILES